MALIEAITTTRRRLPPRPGGATIGGTVSTPRLLGDPSLAGERLTGRYEVRSLLGRGGMGEVYEADDLVLGRTVALKVLPGAAAADQGFLARFRREARTAASLSHPNIVAVHDLVTDGGRVFLVMELVPGRSLSELLADEGPLAPARAASIARQVADALAYAHDHGVVHRDMSSGNIMVTSAGVAKVLDFGIAAAERSTPGSGSPSGHGTVAYLSPEQARGRNGDARSDQYGLGCVLYEMLAGRPPFTGDTPEAIAQQHVRSAAQPVRRLRPDVPEGLDRVVSRCLEKDPGGRFPDAHALEAALRDTAEQAPVTVPLPARPDGSTHPLPHRSALPATTALPAIPRRRRSAGWLAWLGAFVAIGLGAMLIGGPVWSAMRSWPSDGPVAPPQMPTVLGVQAGASCNGFMEPRIDVTWAASAAPYVDGYRILRSTSPDGPFEPAGRISGRISSSAADTTPAADTTYFYRVQAVDGGRLGPSSAVASAHTPFFCLG